MSKEAGGTGNAGGARRNPLHVDATLPLMLASHVVAAGTALRCTPRMRNGEGPARRLAGLRAILAEGSRVEA